mmetsp:Transcript_10128/g.31157  ORF Transcript_10128/g.31157 Transcript_10128/m.31157 type:complete len:264 (-) Transcript_10128:831-1622(-)
MMSSRRRLICCNEFAFTEEEEEEEVDDDEETALGVPLLVLEEEDEEEEKEEEEDDDPNEDEKAAEPEAEECADDDEAVGPQQALSSNSEVQRRANMTSLCCSFELPKKLCTALSCLVISRESLKSHRVHVFLLPGSPSLEELVSEPAEEDWCIDEVATAYPSGASDGEELDDEKCAWPPLIDTGSAARIAEEFLLSLLLFFSFFLFFLLLGSDGSTSVSGYSATRQRPRRTSEVPAPCCQPRRPLSSRTSSCSCSKRRFSSFT